jgi:hypothetical protein
MTPQKTPKQKGILMGFPGTFALSKSLQRQMPGNQIDMDPMDLETKP